jgi:hypothetical protein
MSTVVAPEGMNRCLDSQPAVVMVRMKHSLPGTKAR